MTSKIVTREALPLAEVCPKYVAAAKELHATDPVSITHVSDFDEAVITDEDDLDIIAGPSIFPKRALRPRKKLPVYLESDEESVKLIGLYILLLLYMIFGLDIYVIAEPPLTQPPARSSTHNAPSGVQTRSPSPIAIDSISQANNSLILDLDENSWSSVAETTYDFGF